MRIAFEDIARPSRVAQAIRRHLADRGVRVPVTASRDLVGRMFGYAGWSDLAREQPRGRFLPDHLVPDAERSERREQCRRALIAYGIAADMADQTLAVVAPTGRPAALALDALDFLADQPHPLRRLSEADPAAFLAHPGGARIVRAVQAAATDDPFWGQRGASRLGVAGDEWIVGTMDLLRDDLAHPRWASLVLSCVATAGFSMTDEHRYAGDLGPLICDAVSDGDFARLADMLRDAAPEGLLSLVAHVEDILVTQVARRSPHREEMTFGVLTVASERRPWVAASPFDLRRHDDGDREWSVETLHAFGVYPAEAPDSVCVSVSDGAGSASDIGWPEADGPDRRDDVILIGKPGAEPSLAAALRTWADPAAGAYRIDLQGPAQVEDGEPVADWDGLVSFLLAVILARIDADLRSWSRIVAPGGSLRILVSPGADGIPGRFVRDLVRAIGDRHEIYQSRMADLGFDLVVEAADRQGRPVPLPDLHVAAIPESARAGWSAFEEAYVLSATEGCTTVICQVAYGTLTVGDWDGKPLSGSAGIEEAVAMMAAPDVEAAIRTIVAEAGLGIDAYVVKTIDFVAVLSERALRDRDWTQRIEACLFEGALPAPGRRMRMRSQFWGAFQDELDGIHASRAIDGLVGFGHHVASPRLQ